MTSRSAVRPVLEWIALVLFLAAPLGGPVVYGGVRLWMSGPFLLTTCAGALVLLSVKFVYRDPFRLPPAGLGLLAVCAYTLWSVPGAAVPYEARLEFVEWCGLLLTYWGLTELLATGRRWKIVLGVFLLAGSLLAWYAVIQHARGSNLVLTTPRPEGYGMRASATFFCPNHFAYLLELYVVAGVAAAALPSAGAALRLIGGYSALLALPVLLLTESRSGWIGAVAGTGVFVLLMAGRRGVRRLLAAGGLFAVVVVLVGLALWQFSPAFKQRVVEVTRGNMRTQLWTDTLDMIRDEPVTGHGPGSYRWVYPRYKRVYKDPNMFPHYAHNEYLHLQADYGAAGTVVIGAALLYWLGRLLLYFRRTRSDREAVLLAGLLGAAAATAAHAVFDFNLHHFGCHQAFALLAGLVAGCLFHSGERRPLAWPSGALCAAGAVGVIALTMTISQMLYGYLLTMRAEAARENIELDEALGWADRAVAVYPGYWRAHSERATILNTQAFWNLDPDTKQQQAEAAVSAYEQVLALNPLDTESVIALSKVYGDLLGDQERAIDLLGQIIDFAPGVFHFHSELGLRLRRAGRLEEALAAFETAHAIYRRDNMTNLNLQRLRRMLREERAKPPS